MTRMSEDWCLESRKLLVWHKDRIKLLNKRIADLQAEKESYEEMLKLVEELCPGDDEEAQYETRP